MNAPIIAVLCGGTSSEREVSLGSGKAVALALSRWYPVRKIDVKTEAVPAGLDPATHVVFSTLHGTFGEDGGMQGLLDAAGVHYAGCDARGSALCFDKQRTKEAVAAAGVRVARGLLIDAAAKPSAAELISALGDDLVFKPNCQGSSVGLQIIQGKQAIERVLEGLTPGTWVVEQRIRGRELTVGLLNGKAMGVVEIVPKGGTFDFESKYTKGLTEYISPAVIPDHVAAQVRDAAEAAYAACGCRDYARIDFMLSASNEAYLLEINTLPGMKDTSLLPMSAKCVELDFSMLVKELVAPAVSRFTKAAAKK